jgi:hypothetical protein
MSCGKVMSPKGDVLVVYSTTLRYFWFTDWMPMHGMDAADFLMNTRELVGNWQGKPCYQTAAVLPEFPDAPAVITSGAYVASATLTHFRDTVSTTTKYWIRFGVACNLSSGLALGSAQVQLHAAPNQCMEQVGSGRIVINPGMVTTTDINYFEVGGWAPTSGLNKVMAALVVMNNESTYLEAQLVCRTAQDPRFPNAWLTCEAGWDNPASGNSARNTGALSAPAGANVTTNFLVQWGLAVRKKSGAAGNPRAEIAITVARSR